MIFIVVKFETKPEWTERWPDLVASFTAATRAEEGNLWFEWSRSLDDPAEYVLVESFRDGEAGGVHVNSDHFRQAMRELPKALASTPRSSAKPSMRRVGRRWGDDGRVTGEARSAAHVDRDFVTQPITRRQGSESPLQNLPGSNQCASLSVTSNPISS